MAGKDIKIPEITEDVEIIQKLGDVPGVDDGLNAQGLKAKFDAAAVILKTYINTHVVPAINNYIAGDDGFLKTIGGKMLGTLDMGNQKLTNLASPVNPGDAASKKYTDDENRRFLEDGKKYANNLIVSYANVKVPVEAWTETPEAPNFPWAGKIPIEGVQASMIPEVSFSLTDALSGQFAPVCEAYDGGVYIFADAKPEAVVTIPTIILWRAIK